MIVLSRQQGRGWAVACRLEPGIYWDTCWRARQCVMEALRAFGAGCVMWDGRGVVVDGLSRQQARELQHSLNQAREASDQEGRRGRET
ncbi:MAG: hypothetical protein AMXMBFR33_57880 [Candidatus Xenobia bacterium]